MNIWDEPSLGKYPMYLNNNRLDYEDFLRRS